MFPLHVFFSLHIHYYSSLSQLPFKISPCGIPSVFPTLILFFLPSPQWFSHTNLSRHTPLTLAWQSGYVRRTGQINKEWEPEPNSGSTCLCRSESLNLRLIAPLKGNLFFDPLSVVTCTSYRTFNRYTRDTLWSAFVKDPVLSFGNLCRTFLCERMWKMRQLNIKIRGNS